MARKDEIDREAEQRRRAALAERDDAGQADYSRDYGYDPRGRAGYRAEEDAAPRTEDYGQADYSKDYVFDPETGRAHRRVAADDRPPLAGEADRRSWMDRATEFVSGRPEDRSPPRRKGPSDRVLWAVIVERLEAERRLDLHDVEVIVGGAEVTLNGTVHRKEDKRRIEDIADIEGVRHVQNNLRVRDRGWTFL
ncbi:MAG: BON domain-containing protein [Phenylobacterium sp.]